MGDFEQAGMKDALGRGIEALRQRVDLFAQRHLPDWLVELDFGQAFSSADPWTVGSLVQDLRAAERELRSRSAARSAVKGAQWRVVDPPSDVPPLPSWAADDHEAQKRMVIALGRLALGAAVEAALVEETLDRIAPGAHTAADDEPQTGRLYQDAFLVAIWSSSHAQYIAYIQSGMEEPPVPGISTVPNAAAEWDFSDVYSRRFCQRICPKGPSWLLQVLCRSTNPGSRGWDTLLDSALQDSMATRNVVANAAVVALSAMHPYLHPALRPPWNMRMRIMRVAQNKLVDTDARAALVATAAATKEAVRRMLASTMCVVPAMQAGFAHVGHPTGLLVSPPLRTPARGMEGAMVAFVHAGVDMALELESQLAAAPRDYAAIVNAAFSVGSVEKAIEWDAPWLGTLFANTYLYTDLVSQDSHLTRLFKNLPSQAKALPLCTKRCRS